MRRGIFIASEVRSGSTFVGELIAYHFENRLGNVLFGLTQEEFVRLNDNSTATELLGIFGGLYLGENDWVASKIMVPALSIIVREARRNEDVKTTFFGPQNVWIVVRRRTKVPQAVSLAFAHKTGIWHAYSESLGDAAAPELTPADVQRTLEQLLLSDIYLDAFRSAIPSDRMIEVFYEDLDAGAGPLIHKVAGLLGIGDPHESQGFRARAKVRRVMSADKSKACSAFTEWLLENCHDVSGTSVVEAPLNTGPWDHQFGAELQRAAVNAYREGWSKISLEREFGVAHSRIKAWAAEYERRAVIETQEKKPAKKRRTGKPRKASARIRASAEGLST